MKDEEEEVVPPSMSILGERGYGDIMPVTRRRKRTRSIDVMLQRVENVLENLDLNNNDEKISKAVFRRRFGLNKARNGSEPLIMKKDSYWHMDRNGVVTTEEFMGEPEGFSLSLFLWRTVRTVLLVWFGLIFLAALYRHVNTEMIINVTEEIRLLEARISTMEINNNESTQ